MELHVTEIFFSLVTPFGVLLGLVVTAKISEVTPACLEEDSFAHLKYFLMHLTPLSFRLVVTTC